MHFLLSIALVLQIISAVVVIVLVLMQHGIIPGFSCH